METGSRASYLGSTQGVACLAIEEGLAQAQALAVGKRKRAQRGKCEGDIEFAHGWYGG